MHKIYLFYNKCEELKIKVLLATIIIFLLIRQLDF